MLKVIVTPIRSRLRPPMPKNRAQTHLDNGGHHTQHGDVGSLHKLAKRPALRAAV